MSKYFKHFKKVVMCSRSNEQYSVQKQNALWACTVFAVNTNTRAIIKLYMLFRAICFYTETLTDFYLSENNQTMIYIKK